MKRELLQQVDELPRLYAEIATYCADLGQLVEFYRAFLAFLKVEQDDNFLPILRHILAKGNKLRQYSRVGGAEYIDMFISVMFILS